MPLPYMSLGIDCSSRRGTLTQVKHHQGMVTKVLAVEIRPNETSSARRTLS